MDSEEEAAPRLRRRVLPRREGAGEGGAMREAERSPTESEALLELRWLNEGVAGVRPDPGNAVDTVSV